MDLKKPQAELPFISVIIPFYNNHEQVVQIEKSLRDQSYPKDRFEIIFVDNGSVKSFEFSDGFLERNILLAENQNPNSPYSARNRGIEASRGDIIVFVDANSVPNGDWLEQGVRCIRNSGADLVGGRVEFDFQGSVTAGKIVDALTSIGMKKAITGRCAAYTANLFVRKTVFEEVGYFEEGVRSGGDVRWTLKAKKHGFTISYCTSAIVRKFARPVKALYQKRIRTGRGYYYSWKGEENRKIWFYNFLRSLKPPAFSKIRNLNPDRYQLEFDRKLAGVWFHLYASGIVEQVAFLVEYFRNRLGINR